MNYRWRGLLMGSCLLLGCYGCLSEIFLEVPQQNAAELVIRGWVRDAEVAEVSVRISRLANFSADDIPVAVNDAAVSLWDTDGHSLKIPMEEAGNYHLLIEENDQAVKIRPGAAYQLVVELADGSRYESEIEPLWAVPEPVDLTYNIAERVIKNEAGNLETGAFVQFSVNTDLLQTADSRRSFLKWDFLGVYRFTETNLTVPYPNTRTCYFSEDLHLEKVKAYDGNGNSQDQLLNYVLMEEPLDHRFYDGFYLTVRQQSLSADAFQYWNHLGEIVDRTGSFFEAQPGKIRGNFRNVDNDAEQVFGYFYATQEKTIRLFVPPLPERVNAFCPLFAHPDDETTPQVCLDCQSRAGSTLEKPDYWTE